MQPVDVLELKRTGDDGGAHHLGEARVSRLARRLLLGGRARPRPALGTWMPSRTRRVEHGVVHAADVSGSVRADADVDKPGLLSHVDAARPGLLAVGRAGLLATGDVPWLRLRFRFFFGQL